MVRLSERPQKACMNRVIILGCGGSGKSTLARQLSEITGLRVVEIDKVFWQAGLVAMPRPQWIALQQRLIEENGWIIDGDLGPYDDLEVRLRAADTIILLDFSLARCAWRAFRRSRERADFWIWLLQYRRKSLPVLTKAIGDHAPHATLHVLHNPKEIRRFLAGVVGKHRSGDVPRL
jgi:hypothetical protein